MITQSTNNGKTIMATVTRNSLQAMLDNNNPDYVAQVIGRALLVLFKNQNAVAVVIHALLSITNS